MEVDRIEARGIEGRNELQLSNFLFAVAAGLVVQSTWVLRRLLPKGQKLLPGMAECMACQGSWRQLLVDFIEMLQRPWKPLAAGPLSLVSGRRPLKCVRA